MAWCRDHECPSDACWHAHEAADLRMEQKSTEDRAANATAAAKPVIVIPDRVMILAQACVSLCDLLAARHGSDVGRELTVIKKKLEGVASGKGKQSPH